MGKNPRSTENSRPAAGDDGRVEGGSEASIWIDDVWSIAALSAGLERAEIVSRSMCVCPCFFLDKQK